MPFLEDLRARLAKEIPSDTAARVCEIIRDEWGGAAYYIPRKAAPKISKKDTPQTLISCGVPRRTAYNWINKYKTDQ